MDDDSIGCLGVLILSVIALAVIVYVVIPLFAMIGVAISGAGLTYGGCAAIGNYFASFGENVIDSNRESK